MKKERMIILKMVNEGKITVDEAVRLMDGLRGRRAIDAQEVFDSVKERVSDIVEEAKPVVKKCADKAMEVGEEVYSKGKAAVEKYKNKPRTNDFADDVIIDPVEAPTEAATAEHEAEDKTTEEE